MAHDNRGVGIILSTSSATVLENNVVYANGGDGIQVGNFNGGVAVLVGNADLSLARGNRVFDNGGSGIVDSGRGQVAGNVVYGQTGIGRFGILLGGGSGIDVTENVVYGNSHGIGGGGSYLISNNRVYGQTGVGIWMDNSVVAQNVIYSNAIGIRGAIKDWASVARSPII